VLKFSLVKSLVLKISSLKECPVLFHTQGNINELQCVRGIYVYPLLPCSFPRSAYWCVIVYAVMKYVFFSCMQLFVISLENHLSLDYIMSKVTSLDLYCVFGALKECTLNVSYHFFVQKRRRCMTFIYYNNIVKNQSSILYIYIYIYIYI